MVRVITNEIVPSIGEENSLNTVTVKKYNTSTTINKLRDQISEIQNDAYSLILQQILEVQGTQRYQGYSKGLSNESLCKQLVLNLCNMFTTDLL